MHISASLQRLQANPFDVRVALADNHLLRFVAFNREENKAWRFDFANPSSSPRVSDGT